MQDFTCNGLFSHWYISIEVQIEKYSLLFNILYHEWKLYEHKHRHSIQIESHFIIFILSGEILLIVPKLVAYFQEDVCCWIGSCDPASIHIKKLSLQSPNIPSIWQRSFSKASAVASSSCGSSSPVGTESGLGRSDRQLSEEHSSPAPCCCLYRWCSTKNCSSRRSRGGSEREKEKQGREDEKEELEKSCSREKS